MRVALAGNHDLPATCVEALAADPSAAVRASVARRARLPPSVARALASDPVTSIRAAVAANACETDVLELLACDRSPAVRAAVAGNPETPALFRRLLSRDVDRGVRESAKSAARPSRRWKRK
ncbi:MAG: hypothetical protein Kow0069_28890 [Promethearchaeota archaeon]